MPKASTLKAPARRFLHVEAAPRTMAALAIAVVTWFVGRSFAPGPTAVIASWDAFALTILVLTWITICDSTMDHIRYRARTQDLSRSVIFLFTVGAACASIFAVIALLSAAKKGSNVGLHAALSILAVLASWTLVHTMFAMRYAHAYYSDVADTPGKTVGGLDFPGDKNPGYLDFAYFSFIIGMTAQVSDVQITSKTLRSVALLHGILSFAFNTIILALTINTLSGLL